MVHQIKNRLAKFPRKISQKMIDGYIECIDLSISMRVCLSVNFFHLNLKFFQL